MTAFLSSPARRTRYDSVLGWTWCVAVLCLGCASSTASRPTPVLDAISGREQQPATNQPASAQSPLKLDGAASEARPIGAASRPKIFDYPVARALNVEQLVPSNNRDWAPELATLSTADFQPGNQVTIHNVRNAQWLTDTDCILNYYDKTYDLNDLETVDFIVVPFNNNRSIAHTMLSFGFGKGDYVGISVEVRKEKGEMYNAGLGLARQFELIYVVADEHDLLPVRVKQRASDVFIYRSVAPPDKVRALFVDMLDRVNQLAVQPEFYDTVTNNCTTNIVRHINHLSPGRIPYDYRVLLPGYADRLAYDLGLLDTRLPFEELRRRAWANERIVKYEHESDFSARIRR